MTESVPEPCTDPERLAAFIDGSLAPELRPDVIRHLSRCAKCRSVVGVVAQSNQERRFLYLRRASMAIAAALAAVAFGVLFFRGGIPWRGGRMRRLAHAMPSSARTVEPRFSGFRWAPLARVRRAGDGKRSPEEWIVAGTAGNTLRAIGDDRSQDALHAAGVAYVLTNEPARGISSLRDAAGRAPHDASVWSDLSAALYCDAITRDDDGALRDALNAADRAIKLAPRMPEPYFNRALILEKIGTRAEADAAWESFLAVDGTSGWAAEAREHLNSARKGSRS